MKLMRLLPLLLMLLVLFSGCSDEEPVSQPLPDYRTGIWRDRTDVPFGTAVEYGFYSVQEDKGFPCTMEFNPGWDGPQAPSGSIVKEGAVPFTVAGFLDIKEPHEGINQSAVYESRFLLYMTFDQTTRQVTACGGYMDEGVDDTVGGFDADMTEMYLGLFYQAYDDYISEHGSI